MRPEFYYWDTSNGQGDASNSSHPSWLNDSRGMKSRERYFLFVIFLLLILLYLHVIDRSKEVPQKNLESNSITYKLLKKYWGNEEISGKRTKIDVGEFDEKVTYVHIRDLINKSPEDAAHEFDFSKCKMSNCFDYSRCNSSEHLKVHILPPSSISHSDFFNATGESNVIHENILKIIRESRHYEDDPNKACLFMLSEDSTDRDPLSKSFRSGLPDLLNQEYNYGMNYLVFNLYSGSWPDYRANDFAGFNLGAAILAKASNSEQHHRPKFDISIPLFSYSHPTFKEPFPIDKTKNESRKRKYFLTFKGKRYVIGSGSETRNSLYHLNNQIDVIMLTTCRHGKKWRQASDSKCLEEDSIYEQFDFDDLMENSVFCLTPRGRRLGSFRFLESLSYDCIPIVLSDGWVWPFDEIIDWSLAAIQFSENLVFHVPDMLRDVEPRDIEIMQKNCRSIYRRYFATTKRIVLTTLSVIEKRIKHELR